ncbi:hypothetical protein Emag_001255 [Eimeria magna]
MRPGATPLVYMGAQQQHLQQQHQQQLMQQQQHMEAHMHLQHSMPQQLQQQQHQQQMGAHLQHQYAQQQMEVQLQQQQQLQAQQQEEERQQHECAASAYASAFYGGPPSNPMPPSELAKPCRVLRGMGAAGQLQVYETADDALMRSLQQPDSQDFHNNSTLSGTPRSISFNTFDNGLNPQMAEQGGFPQQQQTCPGETKLPIHPRPLSISKEVHGQTQSTGFIKLHFSSLQEGIPMRVDVINRQGQPNGFLILRYALLSAADAAASAAAYPAAAAADHHAAAAAELARLPTMPSNLTVQQQQQQLRSFRIEEKPQHLQQNYGDKTRGLKPAGARQTKVRESTKVDSVSPLMQLACKRMRSIDNVIKPTLI